MKFDLLIVQIAIIFLPGIVWAKLDSSYCLKQKNSDIEFFLKAFMFGLASYAATFIIFVLFGWDFKLVDFGAASNQSVVTRDVAIEVCSALVAGLLLSVVWIYASTYKWLTRFLQKIKATNTYGDEDVWDYTFNSRIPSVEYVHFRDFDNKFVYAGWVMTYSETEKLRELVLRDVEIFNFEGAKQFEIPLLYLARKPENIHIEFPYKGVSTGERNDKP